MIIRDQNAAVLVGRKVLEDKRISNDTVGFYCRLCIQNEIGDVDVSDSDRHYVDDLIKFGYAKEIDGNILITAGW